MGKSLAKGEGEGKGEGEAEAEGEGEGRDSRLGRRLSAKGS